jgi:hypothetical protein
MRAVSGVEKENPAGSGVLLSLDQAKEDLTIMGR